MENSQFAFEYLKKREVPDLAAAAIVGNLYAGSKVDPTFAQNSFMPNGMAPAEYTGAVDSGTYVNFQTDKAAYGIARWKRPEVKGRLLNFAKSKGTSVGDMTTQLEFLVIDLGRKEELTNQICEAKTIQEASDLFLDNYLGYSDAGEKERNRRYQESEYFYKMYGVQVEVSEPMTDSGFRPYTAKLNYPAVNLRKEPSYSADIAAVLSAKDGHIYQIREETMDEKGNVWSFLDDGSGWILKLYLESFE